MKGRALAYAAALALAASPALAQKVVRIVPHAAGALTLVLPTHGLHSTTHAAAAHAMLAMFSGCGYRRAVCTRARGILSMAMICRIGQQLRTGQHSRCKRRPQQQSFHHLDLL